MLKDLGLGIESARQVGVVPSMVEKGLEVWERAAEDERCMGRDRSSMIRQVVMLLEHEFCYVLRHVIEVVLR
jgi:hypothetical protein